MINALNINDMNRIWYSLQSFLISLANISKILWPDNKYKKRGQILRTKLFINDESIMYSREHRNHLEHFDERLDVWYKESSHHNIMDRFVSNTDNKNDIVEDAEIEFMRFFNKSTFTFIFRGKRYEINPLHEEVKNHLVKVNDELRRPRPV
ncbi:MAG: hypothetical protein ACTHME_02055 [Candidatus Nitrosocosmicus sp.]